MNITLLSAELETFNIPDDRRDISDIDNVKWLLANIRKENKNHNNIQGVLNGLIELYLSLKS